ncbi:hypothetical protein [Dictyobacter vulcani]|nr:hypothetical protein [Dictyobacter vulcani]
MLYVVRYIVTSEAVLFTFIFGFKIWQSPARLKQKGMMLCSLFPFLCVLILIFPFMHNPYPQLASQDATLQTLTTISAYWEAGCGSILFCFVTVFAIKVRKFYGELGRPEIVPVQEPSAVPRRRRVVSLAEDSVYGRQHREYFQP